MSTKTKTAAEPLSIIDRMAKEVYERASGVRDIFESAEEMVKTLGEGKVVRLFWDKVYAKLVEPQTGVSVAAPIDQEAVKKWQKIFEDNRKQREREEKAPWVMPVDISPYTPPLQFPQPDFPWKQNITWMVDMEQAGKMFLYQPDGYTETKLR